MTRYEIRTLTSDDFSALVAMEQDIFGTADEELLCAHYIRMCCDFFNDTCFIALAEGRPVGYLLGFVNGNRGYCSTLAIHPDFQASRVVMLLIRSFICAIAPRADSCWFTVKSDNMAARRLHKVLGATEVTVRKDFYGPGDERIVSSIDREAFNRLREKYQRLGLIEPPSDTSVEAA